MPFTLPALRTAGEGFTQEAFTQEAFTQEALALPRQDSVRCNTKTGKVG